MDKNKRKIIKREVSRPGKLRTSSASMFLTQGANVGRSKGPFVPRVVMRLPYFVNLALNSGPNAYAVKSLIINGAFKPDSAINEGFIGLSEWSYQYAVYQVLETHILKWSVANLETTTPVTVFICFSDTDPSTLITSWQDARRAGYQMMCTDYVQVGGSSGNSVKGGKPYSADLGKVLGTISKYVGEATYASAFSTLPNQSIWMGIVAFTEDPTVFFADGVSVNIEMACTTGMYSTYPAV